MKNQEIAKAFERAADILALLDENTFRVLALRKVARAIDELATPIESAAADGTLEKIPGIGKSSADRIKEYLRTEKIAEFEEIAAQVPAGVLEIMRIPTVGPKTAALLWKEGNIKTVEVLKAEIALGEKSALLNIKGLGLKKLQKMSENLAHLAASSGRIRIGEALPIAEEISAFLKSLPGVQAVQYCGSLRRGKETIGDIDIAVAAPLAKGQAIGEAVTKHAMCGQVIQLGESKTSFRTTPGMGGEAGVQVDVRVVPAESFGAAIQYFTGSKEHNVALRELAIKKGMKVNEWGVYKIVSSEEIRVAGETEEGVYNVLGLAWMPPEMRENKGEIEWAVEAFTPMNGTGESETERTAIESRLIEIGNPNWIKDRTNRKGIINRFFDQILTEFKVIYCAELGSMIQPEALAAMEMSLMLQFPDPAPRRGRPEIKKNISESCIPFVPRFNSQWPEKKLFGADPRLAGAKALSILAAHELIPLLNQCESELRSSEGWIGCDSEAARAVAWKSLEKRQGVYAFRNKQDGIGAGYIGITGLEKRGESQANIQSRIKEHLTDDSRCDNFPASFLREEQWALLGELDKLRDGGHTTGAVSRPRIDLVELADIRGNLHMHTTASDGTCSIEEMVAESKRHGYQYIAITDHSKSQFQANGLKADRLLEHIKAIHAVAKDAAKSGMLVLAGSEVDILADGSLDYEDDILAQLDWVVASPHAALTQEMEPATQRLIKAISNPYVHLIGHPTGRLIPSRRGLEPDMAKVIFAAARAGVALEINAHYYRLDLRDIHARMAVEAKVPLCINTDAHDLAGFDVMIYGILTARRAWATPADVLNAWPLDKFKKWLKDRKEMAGW